MKACTKCGETKPLDAFGPAKRYKDGLRSWCKSCTTQYTKDWDRRNPEKAHEKHQRWLAKKHQDITYGGLHKRVKYARGAPSTHDCACGAVARDWANLTGDYGNIKDYAPMCRDCHVRHDNRGRGK